MCVVKANIRLNSNAGSGYIVMCVHVCVYIVKVNIRLNSNTDSGYIVMCVHVCVYSQGKYQIEFQY